MFDAEDSKFGWEAKTPAPAKAEVSDEAYELLNTQGVALIEKLTNKTEEKKMTQNEFHLNLNLGEYTNLIIDLRDTSDAASIEIADKIAYAQKIMNFVGLKKVKDYAKPVEAPKPVVDPFATTPTNYPPMPSVAQTTQPAIGTGVACGLCGASTKYAEGTSKFGVYRNHVCQNPNCGARGFINKDKNTGADVLTWKAKRK
jgi:hypothetical protein